MDTGAQPPGDDKGQKKSQPAKWPKTAASGDATVHRHGAGEQEEATKREEGKHGHEEVRRSGPDGTEGGGSGSGRGGDARSEAGAGAGVDTQR